MANPKGQAKKTEDVVEEEQVVEEEAPVEAEEVARNPLDEVLPASRRIRGRGFSGLAEHPEEKNTQSNGPEHGVDIDGPEAHFFGFFCGVGKTPAIFRVVPKGPVLRLNQHRPFWFSPRSGCRQPDLLKVG